MAKTRSAKSHSIVWRTSGVDTSRVRVSTSVGTGLSVILQRDQWRNILTYLGAISCLRFEDLDLNYLSDARHFHLSSYYLQKGLRPGIGDLFRRLKAAGLSISIDTNDDPDGHFEGGLLELLRHVDIFLPNRREACKIAKTDNLEAALKWLSGIVPLVVVKLGAEGAVAIRKNEKIESAALKVEMVDPVGAGDSFDAGFLHAYLRGHGLKECMDAGNAAGALCATRAGGTEAFRDSDYRERFLGQHAPMPRP